MPNFVPQGSPIAATIWPGRLPTPAPTFRRHYTVSEAGNALVPLSGVTVSEKTATPNGEVYLELGDVDLDDIDALVAFADSHGILAVRFDDFDAVREFPGFTATTRRRLRQTLRRARAAFETDSGAESWNAEALWGNGDRVHGYVLAPWAETLDEFRFAARCLRDLTSLWRVVNDGLNPAAATWEAIPIDYAAGLTPQLAQRDLSWALNDALRLFTPRLAFERRAEDAATRSWGEAPLYHRCCIELLNHIEEGAIYRTCASETCGRTFVRQRGRAEHGQHRTVGVKFCSRPCARTQVQRDQRRRARAARVGYSGPFDRP